MSLYLCTEGRNATTPNKHNLNFKLVDCIVYLSSTCKTFDQFVAYIMLVEESFVTYWYNVSLQTSKPMKGLKFITTMFLLFYVCLISAFYYQQWLSSFYCKNILCLLSNWATSIVKLLYLKYTNPYVVVWHSSFIFFQYITLTLSKLCLINNDVTNDATSESYDWYKLNQ